MPPEPSSQKEPTNGPALLTEAIAHHTAGRIQTAEDLYRRVIDLCPHEWVTYYRLGVMFFQNNRAAEALPFLTTALRLDPENINILNSLGVASQLTGNDNEALAYFRRGLALKPEDRKTLTNLGRALLEQKQAEAALECFEKLNKTGAKNPALLVLIGKCHFEMQQFDEAIFVLQQALTLQPHMDDALSPLASALWAVGRGKEARAQIERAVHRDPHDPKAQLNMGEFLAFDEGDVDGALTYFERALALDPHYGQAKWRKSFALLAQGKYREGWALYASCLGARDTRGPNIFSPQPAWDGMANPTTRLLLWCEQGLGDSLQFIRYATLCKERVGKVLVLCDRSLINLFERLPAIDHASHQIDRKDFDEHVPIMNLPYIFKTEIDTIPPVPQFQLPSAVLTKWERKLADAHDKDAFKIGLVWAGGAHEDNVIAKLTNLQRSMSLSRMAPLFAVEGTRFVSLQKDAPSHEIAASDFTDQLMDPMQEVEDFVDTAGLIQSLDLVITVDTSVAHLAGSLGKPVWILSRYNADWRWLQNNEANPWYPTARIFGQPSIGDWDSVILKIRGELEREIARNNLKSRPMTRPISGS